MRRTASAMSAASGSGRRTRQTRRSKNRSGQSNASAWTSSGSEIVTAPVSTGSVRTRNASGSEAEELLGTGDPVEEAGHRPERVVGAGVALDRVLDLLEDGIRGPVGEVVAREEQDRDPVDGRAGGPGDHVHGARSDRRRAGVGPEAVVVPGERGRDVDLGLLVLGPVVRHLLGVAELLERLAQAGDVAVPEDAPDAGDEPAPRDRRARRTGWARKRTMAWPTVRRTVSIVSPCATDCSDGIIAARPTSTSRRREGLAAMTTGRARLATPLARPVDLSGAWNASDADVARPLPPAVRAGPRPPARRPVGLPGPAVRPG